MEVKKIRVTNRKQFEELVRRMEENPRVAKGLKFAEAANMSKEIFSSTWAETTLALNSLGPPSRKFSEWQKVWADLKLKTKKKLVHNRNEAKATGGGGNKMQVFSASEESIINLLSLDKAVNHHGSVFGLSLTAPPEREDLDHAGPVEDNDLLDTGIENIENMQPASTSTPRNTPKKRKNIDTKDLLHEQTDYLKQMTSNSEQCARYARKQFHLEEDKFSFEKEYLLREEKRKQQELEYQLATLDYKKRKLQLLEASNDSN